MFLLNYTFSIFNIYYHETARQSSQGSLKPKMKDIDYIIR